MRKIRWSFSALALLCACADIDGIELPEAGEHEAEVEGIESAITAPGAYDEEFVGPFPSWKSIRDYGAIPNDNIDDSDAIQNALNDALTVTQKPWRVLYFPQGTYEIKKPLVTNRTNHADYMGLQIIGEDPATTIWRWTGSADLDVLLLDAWYAKVSRLTIEGANLAHAGIVRGDDFSTYCELSDLIFRNLKVGVVFGNGGGGQAEHAVIRSQFSNCTEAGILTNNFNSLDIWVWHSRFVGCGVALKNNAGNFHAYQNVFQGSTSADVWSGNLAQFSLIQNTSVGSATFTNWESFHSWGAQVLIQGNRIYDTLGDSAITTGSAGPFLLIDNTIRARTGYTGPVVRLTANDQVLVGNKYSVALPATTVVNDSWRGPIRARQLDDTSVARSSIPAPDTNLPPTPPKRTRTIYEVASGIADHADTTNCSTAKTLQCQINAAVSKRGSRPVVHLRPGTYPVKRTITVPANLDVQLIGDDPSDFGSILEWAGTTTGPVPQFTGPSRAVVRDLHVKGLNSDAVLVTNADQAGGRVYANQLGTFPVGTQSLERGVYVNQLERADVTLVNSSLSGSAHFNVLTRGGPNQAAGSTTSGQVSLFGVASSNAQLLYSVKEGGRLVAQSIWYEGNVPAGNHLLVDAFGSLTVANFMLATPGTAGDPAVRVTTGQRGVFSLLGSYLQTLGGPELQVRMEGNGTQSQVYALGNHFWNLQPSALPVSSYWLDQSSPASRAVFGYNGQVGNFTGAYAALPNVRSQVQATDPTSDDLRQALQQLRAARIEPPHARTSGVTDLKLFRVRLAAGQGRTALELRR